MTEKLKSHPKHETKEKLLNLKKEVRISMFEDQTQKLDKKCKEINPNFTVIGYSTSPQMWKLKFKNSELNISLTKENYLGVAIYTQKIINILSECPKRKTGEFKTKATIISGNVIELDMPGLLAPDITYTSEEYLAGVLKFNQTKKPDHRNQSFFKIMEAYTKWLNEIRKSL